MNKIEIDDFKMKSADLHRELNKLALIGDCLVTYTAESTE